VRGKDKKGNSYTIQFFQILKNSLDSGFHRSDDFLREHLSWILYFWAFALGAYRQTKTNPALRGIGKKELSRAFAINPPSPPFYKGGLGGFLGFSLPHEGHFSRARSRKKRSPLRMNLCAKWQQIFSVFPGVGATGRSPLQRNKE